MSKSLRDKKLGKSLGDRFNGLRNSVNKHKTAIWITAGLGGLGLSSTVGYVTEPFAGLESGAIVREKEYRACIPFVKRFTDSNQERPVVSFESLNQDDSDNCHVSSVIRRLDGKLEKRTPNEPIFLPSVDDLQSASDIEANNAVNSEHSIRVLGAGVGAIIFTLVGGAAFLVSDTRRENRPTGI